MSDSESMEWVYLGIVCRMQRVDSNVWCGCVDLPDNHPWYENDRREGCKPALRISAGNNPNSVKSEVERLADQAIEASK